MKTNTTAPDYKGFRFPPEMSSHGVWLYFRFALRFRDVEELMAQRGVSVTSEKVRQWCLKFGQMSANELRHRRPHCGDTWHMDEVFLTLFGKRHSLWRAVDQDGNVLDILVQSHRKKKAARSSFRTLLKGLQDMPRVIITDKLRSYDAAKREILPRVEHRQHKGLNPSRKLASTYTTEREENAEIQISQTGTTLLSADRAHCCAFPATLSPSECQGIPCHFANPIADLE